MVLVTTAAGCGSRTDRLADAPPPVKSVWPELAALIAAGKDLQPYFPGKNAKSAGDFRKIPEKKLNAFRTTAETFSSSKIPPALESRSAIVEQTRQLAAKLIPALQQKKGEAAELFEAFTESLEKLKP